MGGRGDKSGLKRPRGRPRKVTLVPEVQPEKEPRKTAKDQENFADLQRYMHDNYQIDINHDVSSLDFGSVRDNIQGLEEVLNEFPQARGLLGDNFSIGVEKGGAAYACAAYWGDKLRFYSGMFKKAEKLNTSYNQDVASGWSPGGTTAADILRHEMGHLLARAISVKVAQGIQDRQKRLFAMSDDWEHNTQESRILTKAINNMSDRAGKVLNYLQEVQRVSRYAAKNRGEAFAECICDYSKNGENAQELSKEVWKLVKKELG